MVSVTYSLPFLAQLQNFCGMEKDGTTRKKKKFQNAGKLGKLAIFNIQILIMLSVSLSSLASISWKSS